MNNDANLKFNESDKEKNHFISGETGLEEIDICSKNDNENYRKRMEAYRKILKTIE